MARNDSALRILEIGRLLEQAPQGLNVRELQSRLEERGFKASNRTVYRDLQAASQFFPITELPKEGDEGQRFCLQAVTSHVTEPTPVPPIGDHLVARLC